MSYSSHGEIVSVGVKAHVLYSRLLSSDDYWNLLGSDTIAELVGKLRASDYAGYLETLPAEPRRYDVESAIKTSLLKKAKGFLAHLSNPRDAFFRAWVAWYEAENLKSVFRRMAAGRTDREVLRRRLYEVPGSKISYDNILSARNFSEAADAFRGTPYHRILADPLKRLSNGEEKTLFPLEMAVDGYVELLLFKKIKKLDAAERKALLPLFGTWVDLLNLYSLYRAKVFYDLTPEETLNRLLPIRYRVPLSFFKGAVRMESFEEIVEALAGKFPVYKELFDDAFKEQERQLALERNIKRRIYHQAERVFGSGSPGFHTAMSYFVIKEFEINDIIRIIEDVRYGYDRRHAAYYLIRPITSGGDSEWQS